MALDASAGDAPIASGLADRVRAILTGPGISEKAMFGGLCFLIDGNMVAGVSPQRGLLLRIGRDRFAAGLARPGTRPMEMRGRPVEGYLYVNPDGLADDGLAEWIAEAVAFVRALPPKPPKQPAKAKAAAPGAASRSTTPRRSARS
jgi:hypothetical protein